MKVELISWTHNPIETAAKACSMCYKSEPSAKLVKNCIRSGHESTIEHINFTFLIEDIDRATSHQLVRHRIASYSQESQRYVSMNGMTTEQFIYPRAATPDQKISYLKAFNSAIEEYKNLQRMGAKNEDARAVLSNACPTSLVMTMNLRSLKNFMGERMCSRAQEPIRRLAMEMKKAILSCPELDDEGKEIIEMICVPKCEAGKIKFCPEHKSCGRCDTAKEINNFLNNYPVKEIEGKWIFDGDTCHCSVCGTAYDFLFNGSNYCPNCGTKMITEVHE